MFLVGFVFVRFILTPFLFQAHAPLGDIYSIKVHSATTERQLEVRETSCIQMVYLQYFFFIFFLLNNPFPVEQDLPTALQFVIIYDIHIQI